MSEFEEFKRRALSNPEVMAAYIGIQWTDWLASIGYGIDYGAIGGVEPPCTLEELAAAYVRVTGEEDAETWAWTITQETGVLTNLATESEATR